MNRVLNPILLLVPEDAFIPLLTLMVMLGGLCLVVGQKKAGIGLIATAIALPFLSAILDPILDGVFASLPQGAILPVLWLARVLIGLMIFCSLIILVFGDRVWVETIAHILANFITWLFRLLFRWQVMLIWLGLGFYFWWQQS